MVMDMMQDGFLAAVLTPHPPVEPLEQRVQPLREAVDDAEPLEADDAQHGGRNRQDQGRQAALGVRGVEVCLVVDDLQACMRARGIMAHASMHPCTAWICAAGLTLFW